MLGKLTKSLGKSERREEELDEREEKASREEDVLLKLVAMRLERAAGVRYSL